MSSKLEILVVDSGAIIRGHGLGFHQSVATDGLYTVSEVLEEVRDSKARDLLDRLPFELHVRQPSDAAMRAVAAFARRSGDFAALSLTDLKLLALTYTFEAELGGIDHIRVEPVKLRLNPVNSATTKKPSAKVLGQSVTPSEAALEHTCGCEDEVSEEFFNESSESAIEDSIVSRDGESGCAAVTDTDEEEECGDLDSDIGSDDDTDVVEVEGEVAESAPPFDSSLPTTTTTTTTTATIGAVEEQGAILTDDDFPPLGALSLREPSATAGAKSWAMVASKEVSLPPPARRGPSVVGPVVIPKAIAPEVFFASVTDTRTDQTVFSSRILSNQGAASSQARDRMVAEDDGVGWINAGNIDSFRVSGSGILSTAAGSDRAQRVPVPVAATRVACVTTDFTMQNVLLQMNLGVASVDGLLVREVRQWVLRCAACLKVHAAMDRLFCSKCGASHLQRIAASVSAETGELRLHLKRGYRVSSRGKVHPLPKPGSQGKYAGELLLREDQLLSGVWRQKVVKVNRDVRSAFGADVVSDVGLQLNKSAAIKVGLGRTNPNADKGRNKRGSKHRKR